MTANAVHVTPIPDDPPHALDGFCWCQPLAEVEIGGVVYIHRRTLDSPHREPILPVEDGGDARVASTGQAAKGPIRRLHS